jgi:protein TonB
MTPSSAVSSAASIPFDSDRLATRRLFVAVALALGVHLILILGIGMRLPDPAQPREPRLLEVLLVSNPGPVPERPGAVAAQVDRAGETDLPVPDIPEPPAEMLGPDEGDADETALDAESSEPAVAMPDAPQPKPAPEPAPAPVEEPPTPVPPPTLTAPSEPDEPSAQPMHPIVSAADILASRSAEIAALSARLDAASTAYASRARRRAISASTREFRYATYMEAWRRKVERIGNLNYPEAAKEQGLYGSLILRVAVRADGSLESIRVLRSSGQPLLDEAAKQIVELAAPFAPFPPDIAAETDVLDITRTWQFQRNNQLGWGN